MKSIKSRVSLALERGNIRCNHSCEYHPCHYKGQNCSFCYCPFYPCNDEDLGHNIFSKRSNEPIWDCSQCLFNHRNDVVEYSFRRFSELGITDPDDQRLHDVFSEAKERFYRKGKALMVVGATSDAGKSLAVTAICRILSDEGYVVTPFKSQNMSLNSRVTVSGQEISMIQELQSRAAGLKNPSSNVNPILIKPKGEGISQVIVDGKPFGDYDVKSYYNEFVPGPGTETVRRNIEFLKGRYDFIIMEGAGSPSEINIYDKDIANMRAAEIADADCILIVNAEYGGSFAYAVGTLELMRADDRKRVKGIILNNMYGRISELDPGLKELERLTGIPVIGVIPHLNIDLPKEDSEYLRYTDTQGHGSKTIAVIRFPRISNFTDLDPLTLEDVTIKYITSPEQLEGADALILPGTKNTLSDLEWMKGNGLYDAVKKCVRKIPILGICGGYQMMSRRLSDPNGIEDEEIRESEGLGLFDMNTEWERYEKTVRSDSGTMNIGDFGRIDGFEIHMGGITDCNEKNLFSIKMLKGEMKEGCVREEDMLYGTFLHGIFERPAFRQYFMSLIDRNTVFDTVSKDYNEYVEQNIDKLAEGFRKAIDMDLFMTILGIEQ